MSGIPLQFSNAVRTRVRYLTCWLVSAVLSASSMSVMSSDPVVFINSLTQPVIPAEFFAKPGQNNRVIGHAVAASTTGHDITMRISNSTDETINAGQAFLFTLSLRNKLCFANFDATGSHVSPSEFSHVPFSSNSLSFSQFENTGTVVVRWELRENGAECNPVSYAIYVQSGSLSSNDSFSLALGGYWNLAGLGSGKFEEDQVFMDVTVSRLTGELWLTGDTSPTAYTQPSSQQLTYTTRTETALTIIDEYRPAITPGSRLVFGATSRRNISFATLSAPITSNINLVDGSIGNQPDPTVSVTVEGIWGNNGGTVYLDLNDNDSLDTGEEITNGTAKAIDYGDLPVAIFYSTSTDTIAPDRTMRITLIVDHSEDELQDEYVFLDRNIVTLNFRRLGSVPGLTTRCDPDNNVQIMLTNHSSVDLSIFFNVYNQSGGNLFTGNTALDLSRIRPGSSTLEPQNTVILTSNDIEDVVTNSFFDYACNPTNPSWSGTATANLSFRRSTSNTPPSANSLSMRVAIDAGEQLGILAR